MKECLEDIPIEEIAFQNLPAYTALQDPNYRFAPHNLLLMDTLMRVESGEITRLVVAAPPRHGKTRVIGELFPAWYLGRNPSHQVMYATYAYERAGDVGRKVRNQMIDRAYQRTFKASPLAMDSRGVNKLSTDQGGNFFAVGVGGIITGRGANCLSAESKVTTQYGEFDIASVYHLVKNGIKIYILSYNTNTNKIEFKKVIEARKTLTNDLYEIKSESGKILRSTGNHEFYTGNEYVAALRLRTGDGLSAISHGLLQIEKDSVSMVQRICKSGVPVYDLQVEDNSNFFANEILVHNCLLIDDPHKGRKEVESTTQRNRVIEWLQSVAYTRLMPGGKIIVLQTRWHFSDLSGFILEELKHEKWHYLRMPAICDSVDDVLGRQIGDPLWDTDYPVEVLDNIRETIGTREWNAQYQQNPLPTSGGIVKLEWFQRYDWSAWASMEFVLKTNPLAFINRENIPYDIRRIIISIDTAFKEEQINDPTAITIWGITSDYRFLLLNIVNERLNYPRLKKTTFEVWNKYSRVMTGLPITILIEDKGSGQSLIQDLKSGTSIPVVPIQATVSKQIRMSSASPLIESGKVFVPARAPWVVAYETQIARFPLWKEDDLVDSTSQFLNWVSQPQYVKTGKKFWK